MVPIREIDRIMIAVVMVHMVGTVVTVVTMRSHKVGMVGMTLAVVSMVMSTPSRRRGVTVSLKEVTTSHRAGMVSRRRAGMSTVSNRAGTMRTVGMVGMGMGTLLVVVGCVMCRDIPVSRMAVTPRSMRVMRRRLSTRAMLEQLRTRVITRRRPSTQIARQRLNMETPPHLNTRTTQRLNTRTTQLPLQTLPLQHRHQRQWRRRTFVLRSWKS